MSGHNPQMQVKPIRLLLLVKDSWKATTPWMPWLLWAFSVVAVVTLNQLGFKSKKSISQRFGSLVSVLFLAIMVTVTCFTTTAGLIVATGEFFHKAFPKVSYKAYAIIFTLIGFAIANLGLNNIIAFSVPVLLILYPITITIVMIVIANKFVALSKPGMQVTVAVVTLIALLSVIGSQFKLAGLNALINFLPLSREYTRWLVSTMAVMLLIMEGS